MFLLLTTFLIRFNDVPKKNYKIRNHICPIPIKPIEKSQFLCCGLNTAGL